MKEVVVGGDFFSGWRRSTSVWARPAAGSGGATGGVE